MLLFGKVHSKLCRTSRKDCSTQKWRGNELHNQWHHFLMLRGLAHLSNQLQLEHTLLRVLWKSQIVQQLVTVLLLLLLVLLKLLRIILLN